MDNFSYQYYGKMTTPCFKQNGEIEWCRVLQIMSIVGWILTSQNTCYDLVSGPINIMLYGKMMAITLYGKNVFKNLERRRLSGLSS